jgi:hypothetical protein
MSGPAVAMAVAHSHAPTRPCLSVHRRGEALDVVKSVDRLMRGRWLSATTAATSSARGRSDDHY